MLSSAEIRLILLHEFKLGNNATAATRNIIKAWGEGTANERTAQRWFKKFSSGDTSMKTQSGYGRKSDVDDGVLKSLVEAGSSKTIHDLADELGIHYATVSRHLQEMGNVKKLDKWVPHELSDRQRNERYTICSNLILRNNTEPLFGRIVTCDEKWILYDNRRRPAHWLDRCEAPKHFPKPALRQKKVMVTVWWNSIGVIHYSFLAPGQSITADSYCHEIEEMHKKLAEMCPSLVNRKGVLLLHDNARPHIAHQTIQKAQLEIEALPHPPCSPDLSPTDYHLFKLLDLYLRGKIFRDSTDAQNAFIDFIGSRKPAFFADGIGKLVQRWQKCVDSNGD